MNWDFDNQDDREQYMRTKQTKSPKRKYLKLSLTTAKLVGFFCLTLVLCFAAYGTFGRVPMAFTWIGFFLLLSWGLIEAYKEFKEQ